jgi:hypothetical protein
MTHKNNFFVIKTLDPDSLEMLDPNTGCKLTGKYGTYVHDMYIWKVICKAVPVVELQSS